MRAVTGVIVFVLLLTLGATAAPPAAAQGDLFRAYLPLASRGCTEAPICASLQVGPDGICCMGGRPGSEIAIPIKLRAVSSAGLPIELIADNRSCRSTEPIQSTAWEPYVPGPRSYTMSLPVNWTTFSQRFQLRDSAGNLSPILCDDVALEGYFSPGATSSR